MTEMHPHEGQPSLPDPFEQAIADDLLVGEFKATANKHLRRLEVLREQVALKHVARVPDEVQQSYEQAVTALNERKGFLHDVWQEVHGDVGAFHRLTAVREWQNLAETAETPEERQEALNNFNDAREDFEAYLYDPDYHEPDEL